MQGEGRHSGVDRCPLPVFLSLACLCVRLPNACLTGPEVVLMRHWEWNRNSSVLATLASCPAAHFSCTRGALIKVTALLTGSTFLVTNIDDI